jgi:archaemetzincin
MSGIILWWIGEKDPDAGTLEQVRARLERAFKVPSRLRTDPARPSAWDPRRRQHNSTQILHWLGQAAPALGLEQGVRLLGVTDQDLFIPILTFVFGEAQLGGPAAVVSTARLQDETGTLGERLLLERWVKEAAHELGHAYGLIHCATPRCVMARSSSLREVDVKSWEFCRDCRARLDGARPDGE